ECISRRFGVRFQPVMVFPFERDRPSVVQMLIRENFVAKLETGSLLPPESFIRSGTFTRKDARNGSPMKTPGQEPEFAVLRRQAPARLSREAMLGAAALGLPIIVAGHPEDILLRRFPMLAGGEIGALSYFDSVLEFARAKKLRPRSLEEIARESPGEWPADTREDRDGAIIEDNISARVV
ncbi:MAG: hypothetical protein ACREP6_10010, partial [Candidatus Binataceae bacterium]